MEARRIPAIALTKLGYTLLQAIRILAPHYIQTELGQILQISGRITRKDVQVLAALYGVQY